MMMFPSTAALDMTGSSAFTIEADSVEDPKLSTLKVHSGHLHQGIPAGVGGWSRDTCREKFAPLHMACIRSAPQGA